MMLLMMLLTTITAWAENDAVTYIDMNGVTQTVTDYTEVTSGMTADGSGDIEWSSGTYVVKTSVTLSGRIRFDREVIDLIVCDGKTLTVNGSNNGAFSGNTLNIYAQSTGTGMGAVNAKKLISCNHLNIAGGTVTLDAGGDSYGLYIYDGDDSGLTVNGGDVTILNNDDSQGAIYFADEGFVTLNGGKLTVTNSKDSDYRNAIKGHGENTINFNGGTAEINGRIYNCQNINLNGGNVTVNGEIDYYYGYTVTYDFASTTDSYYIQSFSDNISLGETRTVKVAEGKGMKDGRGNIYYGTLTDSDISAISGKTMTPATEDDLKGIVFSITYKVNDGTMPDSYDETYTIESPNIILPTPTREGYTFGGWYTNEGLTGDAVTTIATGSTGDKEFWAKWTPVTYTVSFNANGGEGTMAAETLTYDTTWPLPPNAFTRSGYSFDGWATSGDGDVAYTDGQIVQNLATIQGANVELFAKWTVSTYTISYDLNGGSLPEGQTNPTTYTVESEAFMLVNPVRTDYVFSGWTGTGLDNAQTEVTVAHGSTGNRTYTATWTLSPAYWGEGNDGSSAHPYIITTTAGLDLLATLVNGGNDFKGKYFHLGADIEYDSDVENNFTPIGGSINGKTKYFKGNFNGQGSDGTQYEISGININRPNDYNIGLFAITHADTKLDNIVLRNATITGNDYVGGIVGTDIGYIDNCLVFNTSVKAIKTVSGIICGRVVSNYNNRLINNYYYNCSAKKSNNAAQTANIGTGVYKDINGAKSIHTLSFGTDVSTSTSPTLTYKGTDYYAVGTPITLSYSETVPADKTLFFTVNGEVIDGDAFNMPADRADATAAAVLEIDFAYYWGEGNDGSEAHPYVISTPAGLNLLATMTKKGEHYSGKFFRLGADIDMSGVSFNGIGAGAGNSFSGIFDGGIYDGDGNLTGRHTISGISINRDETAGFFLSLGHYVYVDQAYIGGTVRNLVLEGTVSGGSSSSVGRIGGLAGNVFQNSTVENCVSLLLVDPGYPIDYKGSLVGKNEGTVTGCYYLGMGGTWGNVALNAVGNGNDAINCTPLYSVEAESEGDYPVTMSSMTSDGTIYGDRYHVAGTHVTMTLTAPEREGYALAGFKYQVYNENTYSYDDVNLTDNNDGTYTLTVPAMNVTIEANYSYNGLAGLAQDDQNRYLVTSMNDLRAVASAVDVLEGCSGMTFLLANDIENAGAFSGIAVGTNNGFYGTFDGGGHTISGMTIESDASQVGFIGNLPGILQNLTLKDCIVTATDGKAGMLAGSCYNGYMYHCRVLGGTVTAPSASAIANTFYPFDASDNRYDVGVVVVSDGVIRNPGSCGTSGGDRGSDSSAKLIPVEYIDADGNTAECSTFTRLEGGSGTTTLDGGWYVVASNITFTGKITCTGDAHFILCDGYTMNVGTAEKPVINGILAGGHSISIYAQSTGGNKGQLRMYTSINGIYTNRGNVTINGGEVTANGHIGILANNGNITISGGEVTASGSDDDGGGIVASDNGTNSGGLSISNATVTTSAMKGIFAMGGITINSGTVTTNGNGQYGNGIEASGCDLTISGGQVTANGGEFGISVDGGNMTLGWTNPDDFIHANSYYCDAHSTLSIASGKYFIDEDGNIYGDSGITGIDGKTLTPYIQPTVSYLDENGDEQTLQPSEYTLLTGGGATTLDGGWYVVTSNITFTGKITCTGDAHFILCDGYTMNVGTAESPVSDGIFGYGHSISIYAQSTGGNKGQLRMYTSNYSLYANGGNVTISGGEVEANGTIGIIATGGNITISGGEVEATGSNNGGSGIVAWRNFSTGGVLSISNATVTALGTAGIKAEGDITINSGTITAKGNGESGYGIWSDQCNITISGGQVTANGGYFGLFTHGGNITLGWTNPTDFIYANSYSENRGIINIADDKTLYDEDGTPYSDTINKDAETETYPIDGKTLRPLDNVLVLNDDADNSAAISASTGQRNVILQGRKLWKDGAWNTLCLPFAMTAEQVTAQLAPAKLMTLSSSAFAGQELTLNFEDATTIEPGKPYIIKWTRPDGYTVDGGFDITNPVFTGVTIPSGYTSSDAITAALATASCSTDYVTFIGTYGPTAIYTDPATNLYLGAGNKLYYPSSAKDINSFRAYFQLNNGLTAGTPDTSTGVRAFVLNFGDEETTGIIPTTNFTNYTNSDSDAWYDLSGRKLSGKPTKPGLYINNGRKILVSDKR